MFEFGVSGFRVFERTQEVKIRPITILTGGNSSGKTSFLSALRYTSDFCNQTSTPNSFNKDPFYLGAYEQIAHYRGGKVGRSKEFTFHFSGSPSQTYGIPFRRSRAPLPSRFNTTLHYTKRLGQPALSKFVFTTTDAKLELSFSPGWASGSVSYSYNGEHYKVEISDNILPSVELISTQSLFMSSVIESLLYSKAAGIRKENPSNFEDSAIITDFLRGSLAILPAVGFVGAPVRTRPLRTYDPTDTAPQSEGSHVPSQMAQLARTKPAEWLRTRQEIAEFGRQSGLFNDIELRSLGRGDSDPFQLNVHINGPRRNIIDVGYGVSQAIPIIFELARRRPGAMYIMQQPEVHLHPEAQAALSTYVARNIKQSPGYIVLETHSDFLIDRIRRHVRDGDLSKGDVSILYFERGDLSSDIYNVELMDDGSVVSPIPAYRNFFLKEQIDNLGF